VSAASGRSAGNRWSASDDLEAHGDLRPSAEWRRVAVEGESPGGGGSGRGSIQKRGAGGSGHFDPPHSAVQKDPQPKEDGSLDAAPSGFSRIDGRRPAQSAEPKRRSPAHARAGRASPDGRFEARRAVRLDTGRGLDL